jgi:hypothetical protein
LSGGLIVRNDEYPIYVDVDHFRLLEVSGVVVLRISTGHKDG